MDKKDLKKRTEKTKPEQRLKKSQLKPVGAAFLNCEGRLVGTGCVITIYAILLLF
jgi:hypothetical protein